MPVTALPDGGATVAPDYENQGREHQCVIEQVTVDGKLYPRQTFAEHRMRWYNMPGHAMFTHLQCKTCGVVKGVNA